MFDSRQLVGDDDNTGAVATSKEAQLYNALTFNAVIFAILIFLFESNRHIKLIYLKRLSAKLIKANRVPPLPPIYPFGWIFEILKIPDAAVCKPFSNFDCLEIFNLPFR